MAFALFISNDKITTDLNFAYFRVPVKRYVYLSPRFQNHIKVYPRGFGSIKNKNKKITPYVEWSQLTPHLPGYNL